MALFEIIKFALQNVSIHFTENMYLKCDYDYYLMESWVRVNIIFQCDLKSNIKDGYGQME
jgi:hypothetical protein